VRLDVFLKTSRLVKRRSVAKEMCGDGRVTVGGSAAKPGREVRPGDVITIELSRRVVDAEVVEIPSGNVPKERAAELYRILGERAVERELF
jgi:ribosomal 50S subunit-recycling heat shock protein